MGRYTVRPPTEVKRWRSNFNEGEDLQAPILGVKIMWCLLVVVGAPKLMVSSMSSRYNLWLGTYIIICRHWYPLADIVEKWKRFIDT